MGAQDASARNDSSLWSDSNAPLTDREACDRAAAANDGSAPEVVSNNGRDVSCAAYYSDAAASDSATDARSGDSATDGAASDGDAGDGGAHIDGHDGGDRADADADTDANPDANPDGSSDAASG